MLTEQKENLYLIQDKLFINSENNINQSIKEICFIFNNNCVYYRKASNIQIFKAILILIRNNSFFIIK